MEIQGNNLKFYEQVLYYIFVGMSITKSCRGEKMSKTMRLRKIYTSNDQLAF